MLSEALSYPRNDDGWLKTTLIGGALVFLGGLFFVPIFPVYGYLLRVIRAGACRERDPPRFDDWEALFVDGLKVFVVLFVLVGLPSLLLFPLLFFAVGLGVLAATGSASGGFLAGAGLLVGGLVLLVVLVLLVTSYVYPAALVRMAVEDDVAAAFDLGAYRRVAVDLTFLRAWLLVLALGLTLGLVAALLSLLLVGIVLLFYLQVVVFYLLGLGTGAALDLPDPATESGPV